MKKLNLGSHNKRIKGYENVDALDLENVDVKWNLREFPYPWDSNSVDEILACEVLEHIGFRYTFKVLSEWFRILKIGGKLTIQVPDIEKMIEYYEFQCQCVPRKALKYSDYKADSKCFKCKGKAKIHPERWLFAFTGAQKHPYDAHLNVFTSKSLKTILGKIGFIDIKQNSNIYKIVINCQK